MILTHLCFTVLKRVLLSRTVKINRYSLIRQLFVRQFFGADKSSFAERWIWTGSIAQGLSKRPSADKPSAYSLDA